MINEVIHGVCPSKSNSYRISPVQGMYKSTALREYEKKFYIQCKSRNTMIAGYFEIEVMVFYPSERADLDNSLKIILDCLQQAKVIVNDNRCVKILAQKYLDKKNPRVELTITETNP